MGERGDELERAVELADDAPDLAGGIFGPSENLLAVPRGDRSLSKATRSWVESLFWLGEK